MANTTAGQVATELRKLADALDKAPDTEVEKPMVSFYCNSYSAKDKGKSVFQNVVKLLPRPLVKNPNDRTFEVEYKNDAIWVRAQIDREAVCEIIEPARPAVYHCVPLLSDEEMEEAVKTF